MDQDVSESSLDDCSLDSLVQLFARVTVLASIAAVLDELYDVDGSRVPRACAE